MFGLGLTTTPASSMTTSAVPAERAGMASGMDVSARLITLALNIALMGLVVIAGLEASLQASLGASADAGQLRTVAEQLASGNLAGALQAVPASAGLSVDTHMLQQALTQGFGWVMLYGGISAWITAALSWVVFRRPAHGMQRVTKA